MTQPGITVYARVGNGRWQLAGHADLELPRLLSAHQDLRETMGTLPQVSEGAAHLSWQADGEPCSELIDIVRVGLIASWQGSPEGVGLELRRASQAPSRHLPPGPGHDGFWCMLFPWTSFCGG